jgi:hypothetical protein
VTAPPVILDEAGGSIAYRFHARRAPRPVLQWARPDSLRVNLDGEAPRASHGVDVDEHGTGMLGHGRLYQLIRQSGEVRDRTLEITFLAPHAEAYVFTFG